MSLVGDRSKIEWTEATWNPTIGCTRVSEGCRNCYAERLAATRLKDAPRYQGLARMTPSGPRWAGEVRYVPEALDQPLRWHRPRMIFVNSMSDLFHERVPDEWLDEIHAVMLACHLFENRAGHIFQILTKRTKRMRDYYLSRTPAEHLKAWAVAGNGWIQTDDPDVLFSEAVEWQCSAKWDPETSVALSSPEPWSHPENLFPLPNVWLGTSVENQEAADKRIPILLDTPATIRFLSCEPLLGPIDLTSVRNPGGDAWPRFNVLQRWTNGETTTGIDWVIAGAESGPNARPCHPDWARSLRDQAAVAGIPFFWKSWGDWKPFSEMSEEESLRLYVSNRKAKEWEDQAILDDIWGKRCVVPTRMLQFDGNEGAYVIDGHVAYLMYKVGKKAAGATLDGREWRQMPEVAGR